MNIIKGEKFKQLANAVDIFYCHIHDTYDFFKSPPINKFVLITHNSDGCITLNPKRFNRGSSNDIDIKKINIPDNLIKWFSQNVDVCHEKIESIPIGLENSEWFWELEKEKKIKLYSIIPNSDPKKLLYINHNISTNPTERQSSYDLFKDVTWATIIHGSNGVDFDAYIKNIHQHKFVLCPEGNGIDTHRTWETLYVGSIPIEKRNINNSFYTDLPICFVDSWEDISEEFLNEEYKRINSKNWNLEKLDFDFWKNKINSLL